MSAPIIVHTYVPDHRPEDQAATWQFLESVRTRWDVLTINLDPHDPYHYWRTLRALWTGHYRDRTWLLVEHDVEPTLGLVEEMFECREPMCSRPYQAGPGQEGVVAKFERDKVPWSVATHLGCTKIAPGARSAWPLPNPVRWDVDAHLSTALTRLPGEMWHLHWGRLIHHHNYEEA